MAWADATAALLDAGHGAGARALLHHLTDEPTAEEAFAALAGGLFKPPDELTLRRELDAAADATPIQPPPLPWWAEYGTWAGPNGSPPPIFGTETLDLGGDPDAWPPVTIAAHAIGAASSCCGGSPKRWTSPLLIWSTLRAVRSGSHL
jgi:hypothetical protein